MAEHLSPEQEARLRRLLARSRHDERVPDDVAEHLDGVLARLEAGDPELTGPRARKAEVYALAARRRRTAATMLAAAAAVAVVGVGLGQVVGSSAGEDSLMAESDTAASDDSAESADRSEGRASGEDLDATGGGEIDDQLDEGLDEELAAGAEMLSDGAVSEFSALEDLVVLRGRLADVREERFTRAATRIQRLVIGGDAEVAPQDTTSLRRAAPRVQRAWQGCAPADWGPGTPVAVLYERSPAVLVFRPATGDAQVADLVQCGTGEVLRSVTLPGR
ncbi:hypothetical protein [uncultured Nocardioides sp.]|uniref:hypothetical protein n=1 Tax=uncultured Nocardioides sp. TaxID=198441 RepID=UPI0026302E36|nr:hypothetical protein [uncultured Nocardioides sp.]MCK5926602.1 hypothetical protein [Nocardioides sp.]